tara:strand:- start:984 stop:1163 length:180 start_codon:yes stop_codon:yes gene_type:complete
MYKLILPFESNKIYNEINKNKVIKQIFNDFKNSLNLNNVNITIKDIHTGNNYSYYIIKK